jgi:uncharacterized protein (DUF1499 family)
VCDCLRVLRKTKKKPGDYRCISLIAPSRFPFRAPSPTPSCKIKINPLLHSPSTYNHEQHTCLSLLLHHSHFKSNAELFQMILSGLQATARAAMATITLVAVQLGHPLGESGAKVGYVPSSDINQIPRLRSCEPNTNCVSSGYLEPPNRYMSPLRTLSDKETAYRRAVRDLSTLNEKVEAISKDSYLHIEVPGTAPGSFDDVELLFTDKGIVNLRCEARVTLPPPPFCLKKNCINGNMDQRTRVEEISRVLGLPSADSERMKETAKWTPIFFNSDRVPDMLEYDDYQ